MSQFLLSNQSEREIRVAELEQLKIQHEQTIAGKEKDFAGERERLLDSHAAATEELKQRNENESRSMQDERVAFRTLEKKLIEEKAQLTSSYEEKLKLANQHQQAVVEESNRNYKEAAHNVGIFFFFLFCRVFFFSFSNQCN